MVTTGPCPRCSGLGQIVVTPCPTCRGEGRVTVEHTYQVDVPAGVDSGSTLRLSGRGAAGPRGGGAGDLYVHLRVAEHERYWRDGNDLVTEVPISIAQAALGTTVVLSTLDGDEELLVPAGTQPGREFVLRSRGVPRLQGRGRGDLRAQLVVEVPTKLDEEEAALLRQLAGLRGEPVNPPEKGLFSRIKSAFS
jgi:molecular chaperone DnaJ